MTAADARPLIAHVIYRLDVGGLENGLVNLINNLPEDRYRHAVICLTECTDFSRRIQRRDVVLRPLNKKAGKDLPHYPRLWRTIRELRPAITHTRNLTTLEVQAVAAAAGVTARVHGEHGWDVGDPDGSNVKNRYIRKAVRPFVHRYIALSHHIEGYLRSAIRVPEARIEQIYNGVDTKRFRPARTTEWKEAVFGAGNHWVVGTVGRLQQVKDQLTLLRAFARLREGSEEARQRARLVIVGDGPMWETLAAEKHRLGLGDVCWLAGRRDDVPDLMCGMDVFVLPSLGEGICNTILEAMASGLPVIATAVGGNPELIDPGRTGQLVPPGDIAAQAEAMAEYLRRPELAFRQGAAARVRAEERFSLHAMVGSYARVYDRLLEDAGLSPAPPSGNGRIAHGGGRQGD